jgi:hypothetical protein
MMVSWLSLKTKMVEGFLIWASKPNRFRFVGCVVKPTGGCDDVGHVLRSSGLIHVKASLVRIFQSDLKINGCVMAGGAHGTIAEVVSESS